MLASVQLFDKDAHLVQEYGTKGVDRLLSGTQELSGADFSKRSMTTAIVGGNGKLVGWLQIQLTTKLREHAVRQFAFTMVMIAPVLLLGLGLVGYFFAGKAAQPIERTFSVLKQFVSDAGHELQTPIAVISATTENLAVQLDETPHAPRLAIITRNTDRMAALVSDLMLLAKVDAPVTSSKAKTVVNVDRIAKQCAEEFEDRCREKQISIVVDELQPGPVLGEPDSLQRALGNLLENALRYTNEGGTISISCRNNGRQVRMTIEDTGIGIPPESLPYLFDRFYRVDKSRSRAEGGFGLGLAIVKAIVDNHKGFVEVASEVGKGSRFTIVLPALT
jgi:signal transduction histidine kinase